MENPMPQPAIFQQTRPCLLKLYKDTAVPRQADTLLVPRARWGGTPVRRRAGMVRRPPPPEIASIKPPIKAAIPQIITLPIIQ